VREIISGVRVLVIEDDRDMAAVLEQSLKEEGGHVTVCHNGADGLSTALLPEFDVIVLDIMLPDLDGFELTRRLRQRGRQTPLLMLTARDGPMDIVRGLNLGADDYLTKPFALDVFLARVRAASRRGPATQPVILRAGVLSLNTSNRAVKLGGETVALTRTEYSILELLMRRRDRIVAREAMIEEVWSGHADFESNNLDAFMKLLRSKVDFDPDRRLIYTVRGVGYILRTLPE